MSFFIFTKNLDGVSNTLYKIAENQSDLNNLNISSNDFKIIEDSQDNFESVKYGNKIASQYNNNIITYENISQIFEIKQLTSYVINYKNLINQFTNNNKNHSLYQRWNNYYTQLNELDLNSITYPLNKSLEQYFNELGKPSLNPLQLP